MRSLLIVAAIVAYVAGDCYMQNPRGSNNRLNEANNDASNQARLFDSQNNAAGGYCWGPSMSFYEGSQLTVEWTNQHACSNPNLWCNLVIQYMCSKADADPSKLVRDGTDTGTIPANDQGPTQVDSNGQLQFGMHEPYTYYKNCASRDRNGGLWISDRNVGGQATDTRQNNGGGRSGLECQEERDYYPYWHPNPWKDVAILTEKMSYCSFYQSQSQNVKGKGHCVDPTDTTGLTDLQYNNPAECGINKGKWTVDPAWKIPAPDCVQAPWSRDNHLGNGRTGYTNHYNWTLPVQKNEPCIKGNNCNCVLRIRYNISTSDVNYDGKDRNQPGSGFIDWTKNGDASPVKNDEYKYQDNLPHWLAMDTTQFGRTFQDRSFVFHIKPRPSSVPDQARIFNLNVRGKRGNIVQTYPATEYDFVPQVLYAHVGDYIHFQWTGCDTNPTNQAGEGTDQTDRSNIVQLSSLGANVPATDKWMSKNTPLFESKALRQRMAMLGQTNCLNYTQLMNKTGGNKNNAETDLQDCMKLNAAPTPYFDGGLIRMNKTGDFYYMSSRNNNFSNRSHKGIIHITNLLPTWAIAVVAVGAGFFLLSGSFAGMMLYAKSHPHSGIAGLMTRI